MRGALLAVFTVFVFLRRARPTLIVATAIPISLIASFGLVWLFGYTLNTMTLLGMTLAVQKAPLTPGLVAGLVVALLFAGFFGWVGWYGQGPRRYDFKDDVRQHAENKRRYRW